MKKRNMAWWLLAATPVWLALCVCAGVSRLGIADWRSDVGQRVLWVSANRVVAGFVVGAALSCAGVVLQALLRNPLADPYVLGVSGGAALGAAVAIFTGLSAVGALMIPGCAFAFGIATLALVYFISRQGGSSSMYGLLLSGVIVSSICSSLLMLIISLVPVEGLHGITWWMLGNLQVMSGQLLIACSILIVIGIAGAFLLARELNALTLGWEAAYHLGVRAQLAVKIGLAVATLATAAAVGVAGLIGFVGLIIPHIVRNIIGSDHRRLIPAAALAGGIFLTMCDTAGRVLFTPLEIPVGVITALIGGPFFLVLLRKKKQQGWLE